MKKARKKVVRKKSSKANPFSDIWFRIRVAGGAVTALFLMGIWNLMISSNMGLPADKAYFYVEDSMEVATLLDSLENRKIIGSRISAQIYYELFGSGKVRPGLYTLEKSWNNYQLFNHLQEDSLPPARKIKIPAYKLRQNVIASLADQAGHSRSVYWKKLRDEDYLDSLGGYNKENIFCIFRPGDYYVYEGTSEDEFFNRLKLEYDNFWNRKRRKKAKKLDLTPEQVTILASIVYWETKLKEEMPRVAGVYINRLKKNMKLQADPTVVYAAHKFGARRVYYADKKIKSPYNTYMYKGLPPGPIYNAPGYVIDYVLDYEDHDYLYFCAKHDLSGCHLFAETYEEHKKNAERYRNALDKAGVY